MPPSQRQIDTLFAKMSPLLILCPYEGDIDLAMKDQKSISEQMMYWVQRVQELRQQPGGQEAYELYHTLSGDMEEEIRLQGQKGIEQVRNESENQVPPERDEQDIDRLLEVEVDGEVQSPVVRRGKTTPGTKEKTAAAGKKNKAKPGARAPINISDRQKEIGQRFKTQMKESKAREW